MLVRRFGQHCKNVHTFCLCAPPQPDALRPDCGWLVVMGRRRRSGFVPVSGAMPGSGSRTLERLVRRLS